MANQSCASVQWLRAFLHRTTRSLDGLAGLKREGAAKTKDTKLHQVSDWNMLSATVEFAKPWLRFEFKDGDGLKGWHMPNIYG
ncbi:MAG: hypothetical protein WAU45_08530, partial [Blastocatellia bacterium]